MLTSGMSWMLEIEHLVTGYGGVPVLHDVSLKLGAGELIGLLGANNAGKTTLINNLSGIFTPMSGRILFEGQDVTRLTARQRVELGIVQVPEGRMVFPEMSVLENVMAGQHCRTGAGVIDAILRLPSQRREEAAIRSFAEDCLSFVGITEGWEREATTLPYGWQRRVEIARALATQPKLLLLDEPAAGLTSGEKEELIGLIGRIRDERGIAVLLIEHDTGLVMRISERISVLDHGVMIAEGAPKEIQSNQTVIEAYLGVAEDALDL